MLPAEIRKHLREARKDQNITLAGIAGIGDAGGMLIADGRSILLVDKEEAIEVFQRRDLWPEIPLEPGKVWVYRDEAAPYEPDDPEGIIDTWQACTAVKALKQLDLAEWVRIMPSGEFAYLVVFPGGEKAHVPGHYLWLVSGDPRPLKYYGTTPDAPIVVAVGPGLTVAVIHPCSLSAFEDLPTPGSLV